MWSDTMALRYTFPEANLVKGYTPKSYVFYYYTLHTRMKKSERIEGPTGRIRVERKKASFFSDTSVKMRNWSSTWPHFGNPHLKDSVHSCDISRPRPTLFPMSESKRGPPVRSSFFLFSRENLACFLRPDREIPIPRPE